MRRPTVEPDLSLPPGFGASTQTCTVVLLGSSAGLTTRDFSGDFRFSVAGQNRSGVANVQFRRLLRRNVRARDYFG